MTVEEKAEEYTNKELTTEVPYGDQNIKYISESDVIQAFIDGYHECQKEHEWHYVKDGLPKESKKYYVYSEEWGVEVRKFIVDAGCFECRNNIIIAWKEIVLPELKEK